MFVTVDDLDHLDHPVREPIGALIHDVDGGRYVKISDHYCRVAEADELSAWDGPVSPWHMARLYPRHTPTSF